MVTFKGYPALLLLAQRNLNAGPRRVNTKEDPELFEEPWQGAAARGIAFSA